jgi:hypothetical protein
METTAINIKPEDTMVVDRKDYNISLMNNLKWPLIIYGLLFGYYAAFKLPGKFAWFSWHPLFMLLSFITLAGNAALIKKVGGYENTKLHVSLA